MPLRYASAVSAMLHTYYDAASVYYVFAIRCHAASFDYATMPLNIDEYFADAATCCYARRLCLMPFHVAAAIRHAISSRDTSI